MLSSFTYNRLFSVLFLCFITIFVFAQTGKNSFHRFSKISSFALINVKQEKSARIIANDKPLSLFVFLSPECPLCQNYTRTLKQLREKYKKQVNCYGVIPGNAYTIKEVADFKNKYTINFDLFIDTKQNLTHYLNATVTPQVVLINNKGSLVYTGAIDDWVQAIGKKRLQVSQHYVNDAIEQSLQPAIVKIKATNAIGCKINDY